MCTCWGKESGVRFKISVSRFSQESRASTLSELVVLMASETARMSDLFNSSESETICFGSSVQIRIIVGVVQIRLIKCRQTGIGNGTTVVCVDYGMR